jgi:hypothetical protein
MKKVLLVVIALVLIGVTSCKKEAGVQPEVNAAKVLDKKDTAQWD